MTRYHPPRITLHRGAWSVSYYEDGKRCRASLGTDDLDEARRRFAVWRKADRGTAFKRQSTIYFIRCDAPEAFVKIGIARDLATRLSMLQTSCPYPLSVLSTMPGGRDEEADLHSRFAHLRVRGEWFREAEELTDFIAATIADEPPVRADTFHFGEEWRAQLAQIMADEAAESADAA